MWIAQCIHQHQAAVALNCSPSQVLVDGRPPPALQADTALLIPYADNLNVVGTDKKVVQDAKDKVVGQLRAVGFRVHEEEDSSLHAQALGFILDGEAGEVQPIPSRRDKVRLSLLWLAKRPKITGKAIERIIGHCVHLFMLRRDLLSIFRSVYDFKIAHYDKPCKLWRTAAEECRIAAALILTCSANLRKSWDNTITVSDASLSGTAVAALTVDPCTVQAIGACRERWRFKSKDPLSRARDAALKLDPFVHHETVLPMSQDELDPFQLNLEFQHVPVEIACSDEWQVQFACRMKKPEHITVLEGRGTVQAIRHKMRSSHNFNKKHLHLGDNLGMVLAFDRGRAKAVPLLICCRRATAFAIAGNCDFTHRWVPSEHNAADAGSRQWEPSQATQGCSKGKAKKFIEAICHPKHSLLTKPCNELFGGGLGVLEECSSSPSTVGGANQTEPQESRASSGRGSPCSEASGSRGNGQTQEPQRAPYFPGDSSCGSPHQRGVPSQVEPVHVVLPNSEVEAAKRGRCGLRLDALSEPSFLGGLGHQRRCKVHGGNHGQKAGAGGKERFASSSPSTPRVEKHGSRGHKTAIGMATGGSDSPDNASKPQDCRVRGSAFHVRDLRQARRSFSAKASRPGQKPQPGSYLGGSTSPLGRPPRVQGGGEQRDLAAGQSGAAMAGSCAGMHGGHRRWASSPHHLQRGQPSVELSVTATGARRQVCGAVPFRSKLGQVQGVPNPSRSQAAWPLGVRQQPQEVRTACDGGTAVREAEPSFEKACAGSAGHTASHGPRAMWPEQVKIQKPFLELFAGCGRLSAACVALGIPAEAWDIEYGRSCNVLNPVVARRLLARIRNREFSAVHLGMPCSTWSMARRHDGRGPEPLRSDTCLHGLPNLTPADNKKVYEGNQLLAFSITVIELCNQLGIPWTLENPFSSRVWLHPDMQWLVGKGAKPVHACFCMYGTRWRKATTFLSGHWPGLALHWCPFAACKRNGRRHVPLAGQDAQGRWLTRLAQPYPVQLCEHYALQLLLRLKHTPGSDMGKNRVH